MQYHNTPPYSGYDTATARCQRASPPRVTQLMLCRAFLAPLPGPAPPLARAAKYKNLFLVARRDTEIQMSSSELTHQNLGLCGFDAQAAKRKYGVDVVPWMFMKKGNSRALEVPHIAMSSKRSAI